MHNKIVVRYRDGRVIKGVTEDFFPNKYVFHIFPVDSPPGSRAQAITLNELKAVFFVRDFTGDPSYQDKKDFESNKPGAGRKIKVVFRDGETLIGMTQGYQQDRPGFFIEPADAQSNIERCFVVAASAKQVLFP